MRDFRSFDKLLEKSRIIWEDVVPAVQVWPSEPPPTPEERQTLLKKVKRDVEKARFRVAKQIPTIGIFLQNLKTLLTWDVKTMAVDDKGNIYINPTFANFLPDEEVKGVLIHEAMHVFTKTFFRKGGRNHKLWNICTDYLMNYYIVKDGFKLPEGGCIPDEKGDVYFTDGDGKRHVFNIIGKTAEWLYAQADKLPKPPPGKGGGRGEPGQGGEPGEPSDDGEPGEPGEDDGGGGEGTPTPVDPKTGKALSATDDDEAPESPELEEGSKTPNTNPLSVREIETAIRTAIRTAKQKEHEAQQGRGTGQGAGLEDIMIKETEAKTNYKQLLKNLAQEVSRKFNWRRLSRRGHAVGSWIPKMVTDIRLAKLAIAIDTSGSVGDKMIMQIIAECIRITQMFPGVELDIIKWDTSVYFYKTIKSGSSRQEVQQVISSANRRGGTIMSAVADFYEKNKGKKDGIKELPKAILYFTDGGVESNPKLVQPPTQNYFLIVPGGTDYVLKTVKGGVTYNIEV